MTEDDEKRLQERAELREHLSEQLREHDEQSAALRGMLDVRLNVLDAKGAWPLKDVAWLALMKACTLMDQHRELLVRIRDGCASALPARQS